MKLKINLDILGVATSVACAIHCAVLPLLLTSLPLFGINLIHNIQFEVFMISLAFGIGSLSLIHGYRRHHHRLLPLMIFSVGFACLVLKELITGYELWLLIPAVSLILTGHFYNFYYCRQAGHCHVEDCNH